MRRKARERRMTNAPPAGVSGTGHSPLTPAKAGVQGASDDAVFLLDSRFRE